MVFRETPRAINILVCAGMALYQRLHGFGRQMRYPERRGQPQYPTSDLGSSAFPDQGNDAHLPRNTGFSVRPSPTSSGGACWSRRGDMLSYPRRQGGGIEAVRIATRGIAAYVQIHANDPKDAQAHGERSVVNHLLLRHC